jgi:exonuclease III
MEWINYNGIIISQNTFHITVALTSTFTDKTWYITNIYAPCNIDGRNEFIQWFADLDSSQYDLWMSVGEFNLIKSSKDRNRPGGNVNNMIMFNSLIQIHDLEEIPLKGRAYTWSNMQNSPLLEKLDWIFTSSNWATTFRNTLAEPMARRGSDHVPILIQIGSEIPRCQIFRFE